MIRFQGKAVHEPSDHDAFIAVLAPGKVLGSSVVAVGKSIGTLKDDVLGPLLDFHVFEDVSEVIRRIVDGSGWVGLGLGVWFWDGGLGGWGFGLLTL